MNAAPKIERDPAEVVCVGRRVDWLTLAFRVRFSKAVLLSFVTTADEKPPTNAPFAVRAYLAKKHRVSSVKLQLEEGAAPAIFRIKFVGESKTILENGSCRVLLHENAPKSPDDDPNDPGWTLAVEWSGVSLIHTTYDDAARLSFKIAQALGEVLSVRLRRLDLCADMEGFEIPGKMRDEHPDDGRLRELMARESPEEYARVTQLEERTERHGWCTRPQLRSRKMRAAKRCPTKRRERKLKADAGRKLLARYENGDIDYDKLIEGFPDIDDTYYFPEGNCTGWKFGKGVISARVYDKQAELRMRVDRAPGAASKKEAGDKAASERAWWKANKWQGGMVTRVEVQCRGEVLHELDARCDLSGWVSSERFVSDLGDQLDRVWRYFAGSPDELARKEPLPVDELGRCTKCKVVHESPEACKYTLAPKSGWLRQIVLDGGTRRSECTHTPAWDAVQRVSFNRVLVDVPQRTRKRGAVRATQVLGCALALLGYTEQLPNPVTPDGVVVEHEGEDDAAALVAEPARVDPDLGDFERRRQQQLAADAARKRVQDLVLAETEKIFAMAAKEVAETLNWIHEEKPEDALALVWVRQNAAQARWRPLAKAVAPKDPGKQDAGSA